MNSYMLKYGRIGLSEAEGHIPSFLSLCAGPLIAPCLFANAGKPAQHLLWERDEHLQKLMPSFKKCSMNTCGKRIRRSETY